MKDQLLKEFIDDILKMAESHKRDIDNANAIVIANVKYLVENDLPYSAGEQTKGAEEECKVWSTNRSLSDKLDKSAQNAFDKLFDGVK